MPYLRKSYEITPGCFVRAGEVSIQVQSILKSVGLGAELIRRASICAYEAEINVVMHGGEGTFVLSVGPEEILMEISDNGSGIEDIKLALSEGYSTARQEHREIGFGAGMGLPNIMKNSDRFDIESKKGVGTHLKIVFMVDLDGD
ncbi:MAG: anti-sigma regulatory factor [Deltaproteobacteria bacterium]|nr:anti-sigma regulatory factor [Deltaproteobacteria bacterium]